jgi:hypothetical protein
MSDATEHLDPVIEAAPAEPLILEPEAAPPDAPAPDITSFDPAAAPDTLAPPDASPEAPPADDPPVVHFRSTMPELQQIEVMGIFPRRDSTMSYLIWDVPADDADRFERHCFVVGGRISRQA